MTRNYYQEGVSPLQDWGMPYYRTRGSVREDGWANDPGRDEVLEDAVHVYLDLVSHYSDNAALSRYKFMHDALKNLPDALSKFTDRDRGLLERTADRIKHIAGLEKERRIGDLSSVLGQAEDTAKDIAAGLNESRKPSAGKKDSVLAPGIRGKMVICGGPAGC